MSETTPSRDDSCYRHPGRVSYVLCQRCARIICGDCQIPAPVGVHCPECHQSATGAPVRRVGGRAGRGLRLGPEKVTYSLLALIAVVHLAQLLSGGAVTSALLYWPPLTLIEPWRALTALFVHSESSLFHILFNGYSLWVLGMVLERLIGHGRFLGLFLTAGLGGSVAVLLLAPSQAVIGASGAIFGLFGALLVIERSLGSTNPQLLIVLVLNLVLGFVVPGISWQAHIGGLVTGVALGWLLVHERGRVTRTSSWRVFGAVVAVLAALAVTRIILF